MVQTDEIRREIEAELRDLADQINREHDEFDSLLRGSLERAAHAGRLLLEVKAKLGYGEFGPWVRENCRFAPRTAQRYIRVARHAREPIVGPQAGRAMNYNQALKALTAPSRKGRAKKLAGEIRELIDDMVREMTRLAGYIRHRRSTCTPAAYRAERSILTKGDTRGEIEGLFRLVEEGRDSEAEIRALVLDRCGLTTDPVCVSG